MGYRSKSTVIEMSPGKHTLALHYYEWVGNAKVSFTADSHVLTWQETEYQYVTKQRTVSYPFITLGLAVSVIGIILIITSVAFKPKPSASEKWDT